MNVVTILFRSLRGPVVGVNADLTASVRTAFSLYARSGFSASQVPDFTRAFHAGQVSFGNPRSIPYDLNPQEPKSRALWEYRQTRYSRANKSWVRKVRLGDPQFDFIPDGDVNREGRPYTTQPLPYKFTLGRDPVTGKRVNHRWGKGAPRDYRMLDRRRYVPVGESSPFVERVLAIVEDETRTAHLALVANGNFKRYITASENMKAGDLIKTYNEIPLNPVQALEGDAYPAGALATNSIVHNIETQPGSGGAWALKAGEYGTIARKIGDHVVISVYRYGRRHNQEISVDERCMVTVGRASNAHYHLIPIGGPVMLRRLGYRSRSGLFQKKDGRFGRKIKPPPRMKVMDTPPRPFTPIYQDER